MVLTELSHGPRLPRRARGPPWGTDKMRQSPALNSAGSHVEKVVLFPVLSFYLVHSWNSSLCICAHFKRVCFSHLWLRFSSFEATVLASFLCILPDRFYAFTNK